MFVILTVIFLFIISANLVLAQTTTSGNNTPEAKVSKAYTCLENKVKGKCDTLTLDQQIFSILALKYDSNIRSECKMSLVAQADLSANNKPKCWPKDRCGIKTTAQSILALSRINENTDDAESWLISQNTTPTNLNWYLQIESNEETTCSISYGPTGPNYNNQLIIGTNKKISGDAGSCLPIDTAGGSYWLRINSGSDCYTRTYTIKCNKGFLTTLLYKRSGSSTVYVSDIVNSASADGETSEKINSVCFGKNGICDYEGSLWASITLDALGYDVTSYLPYLTSNSVDYPKLLPDSFLYLLKDYPDFYGNLINLQKQSLWEVSGDKFYDTALALLALNTLDISQVTEAKTKLLTLQDAEGCWQGNIRNTAFILFSAWPRQSTIIDPVVDTPCDDGDNPAGFCRSRDSCLEDGGEVLENFDCSGISKCCSVEEILATCDEEGGKICSSSERCTGQETDQVTGVQLGESCCLLGDCVPNIPDTETDCERFNVGGVCKSECGIDEDSTSDDCGSDISSICCIPLEGCTNDNQCQTGQVCKAGECVTKKKSSWFIWLLIILIILVILAIIFRTRVKMFLLRFRKGKGDYKPQGGLPPRGLPPRPGMPPQGMPPQNRFAQGSPLANRGMPQRSPPPQIRPMFGGMTQRMFPPRPQSPPQRQSPPTPQRQLPPSPQKSITTKITTTKTTSKPAPKKDKDYEDVMEKLKKISK